MTNEKKTLTGGINMRKTTPTIFEYQKGKYLLTAIVRGPIVDFYISNRAYGDMEYMFGIPTNRIEREDDIIDLFMGNYIEYTEEGLE
jgi:hypothetical protein